MKYQLHTFFIVIWAVTMTLSSAFLTGIVLGDEPLQGRWILTHVVQADTSEGERLVQHLLHRKPIQNYDELVVLPKTEPALEKALQAKGFHVSVQDWKSKAPAHEELNHPFYFLTSPRGESFFAGNYVMPDRDFTLIQDYFKRQSVTWLPLWTCNQALNVANLFTPHLVVGSKQVSLPQVD